jgi:hypothetical protein
MVGHNRVSFSCNIVTLSIGLELFFFHGGSAHKRGPAEAAVAGQRKRTGLLKLCPFFPWLPTMPLFSWGNLLNFLVGSPPEKMHAHQRSLSCFSTFQYLCQSAKNKFLE